MEAPSAGELLSRPHGDGVAGSEEDPRRLAPFAPPLIASEFYTRRRRRLVPLTLAGKAAGAPSELAVLASG